MANQGQILQYIRLRRRRGRKVLEFYEGGTLIAAATLRWEDLVKWLDELGFRREGELYVPPDSTAFMSSIILFGVAQTKRKRVSLERLKDIVGGLELIELRLWSSYLKEGYEKRGLLGMYRPAKAFKILFGV